MVSSNCKIVSTSFFELSQFEQLYISQLKFSLIGENIENFCMLSTSISTTLKAFIVDYVVR